MGATGFCMGGALALAAAALLPEEISAAAPFYGIPRSDLCDVGMHDQSTSASSLW